MFIVKIIVWLVIGAIVGYLAGSIMDTGSKGFWGNAVLGIIGSLVGGLIGNLLGVGGGWVSGLILAIVGSCLVIFILGKLKK